jgi:DNA-binding LacI/PurR family transcriptional regulator
MDLIDQPDRRQARPAVMADVARLAGVSHQTVSRVLNESERVSSETRARVLAAMTKLDYRPNPTARALASGRSKTVGVITFDTPRYGPASALFGIERAAHEAGFFVSVASLKSLDMPSLISTSDNLRRQNVEGILVIAPQREVAQALTQLPHDLPVVAVEAGPAEGVPVVAVHQFKGAALVRDPAVTAIFAANDAMALGVLRRIHEAGRDAPGSISVVGFDDVPEAEFYTPPLTTIRQDFIELGRSSFGLVLDEIESGARTALRVTIAPELIVRASTAPPHH